MAYLFYYRVARIAQAGDGILERPPQGCRHESPPIVSKALSAVCRRLQTRARGRRRREGRAEGSRSSEKEREETPGETARVSPRIRPVAEAARGRGGDRLPAGAGER